jgi:hypothetical protein
MNDVCIQCAKEMRCIKNGGYVVLTSGGEDFYYRADLYECEGCGHKTAKGIASVRDDNPCPSDPVFVNINTDGNGWER